LCTSFSYGCLWTDKVVGVFVAFFVCAASSQMKGVLLTLVRQKTLSRCDVLEDTKTQDLSYGMKLQARLVECTVKNS
jgi:hypothetical protein